jgi:hypothetical protein
MRCLSTAGFNRFDRPSSPVASASYYSTTAMAQATHAEAIALCADLVNVKGALNAVIDDQQAVGFTT